MPKLNCRACGAPPPEVLGHRVRVMIVLPGAPAMIVDYCSDCWGKLEHAVVLHATDNLLGKVNFGKYALWGEGDGSE